MHTEPHTPEAHGLKAGKRYLFQDLQSRDAWSATVLELSPTHVHLQFDQGTRKWFSVLDFIRRNDGRTAQTVLCELGAWPVPVQRTALHLVEPIMALYLSWEAYWNKHGGTPAKRSGNFRARLKALLSTTTEPDETNG